MKLSPLFVALSASAANALTFTNANFYNISVGNPFNITWEDASGAVSLTLLKGGTEPFFTNVSTFASKSGTATIVSRKSSTDRIDGLTSGSYMWTPADDLTSDTYLIHFQDSSGASAYGFYFALVNAPYSLATTTTKTAAKTTSTAAPQSTYTWP